MNKYLASSPYIDWKHSTIKKKAAKLSKGLDKPEEIINACFEYVRDEIKHSNDYKLNPITCKASDVLEYKTGYCFAKSHLLAALLRANNIPTGLCYQRLSIDDMGAPFSLHGLNAVHLQGTGWYRIDARGNKEGINAQFCPPKEKLAFPICITGEADLPEVWAEPLETVVDVLTTYKTYQEVLHNLPDIEIF